MMNKNQQNLLSKMATGNGHGENSPYFDGWKVFEDNPFYPTDSPHGVIQMGLAENQAVANFMEKVRGNRARFDPDRIVMSGGATGAHELPDFPLGPFG
ncbi:hypothetical protein SO802_032877 [Lithocarpus litseifolius]|uniref:Uncharacterized protein n=1 Tax=Lithocarpus litseifolius TaxID=425828 RepID=A0AAW2BC07_9ROSI